MCYYLDGLIPQENLDNLKKYQVTGADWAWTITKINDMDAFKAETGVTMGYVMARLVRESRESPDADAQTPTRGNVTEPEQRSPGTRPSEERVNREWERTDVASPPETREKTRTGDQPPKLDAKAGRYSKEDMARATKTERYPKSPDFDNQRKMCTRDEWEDYSQNMSAWLGMYSPRLAHLAEQIKSDSTVEYESKNG